MAKIHYFVTGTDTGVGKTVVSMLLMRALTETGRMPFYFKPVQTGCRTVQDADSDARFVYAHCPQWAGQDPAQSVGMLYTAPRAPLFAARDAGTTVEVDRLRHMAHAACERHEAVVMEGAGGVLVPLTRAVLTADFIHMISRQLPPGDRLETLVVARTGLGTINHTLLTLEALRSRDVSVRGVVMVQSRGDALSPGLLPENIEAVELIAGIPVWGVVPVLADMHTPPCRVNAMFCHIAGG